MHEYSLSVYTFRHRMQIHCTYLTVTSAKTSPINLKNYSSSEVPVQGCVHIVARNRNIFYTNTVIAYYIAYCRKSRFKRC